MSSPTKRRGPEPPRELPALGFTIREAAQALGATEYLVRDAVEAGRLRAYRVGKDRVRIAFDDALRWLHSQPRAPLKQSADGR